MASPPHIKFEAQHGITTIVEGDELDLREAARLRFARCLGAICFASNPLVPGVVREIRWERLEQAVPGQGPDVVVETGEWGASAAIMPALIGPFTTQTATNLRAIEAMVGEVPAIGDLLALWSQAQLAELLAFNNQDWQEVLLRYCHVLEKIGDEMAPALKKDTPAAIVQILEILRTTLGDSPLTTISEPAASRLAAAVVTAHREVQRLRLDTIGQKIRAAGEALNLPQVALKSAREAWEKRSALAGHPSQVIVEARARQQCEVGSGQPPPGVPDPPVGRGLVAD
ncbi:MAG: hypothetical protein M3082_07280 [Candidatus Dormibacteraeota bacterium]|nr:hypothetical protein [Candidatus Dormibacteraeota bacterium]